MLPNVFVYFVILGIIINGYLSLLIVSVVAVAVVVVAVLYVWKNIILKRRTCLR